MSHIRIYRNIICILALVGVLSGCLVAALATGAVIGGAVVYDKRSVKTAYQDNDIEYQAMNLIQKNTELANQSRISVTSFNHVLLLVGETPKSTYRTQAEAAVKNIPNVKRVVNQITIGQPISLSTQSNDSWITTQAKSKMLATSGLSTTQIKVVTENSIIYLMGIVTPKEGTLASQVASQVSGVQKVVTAFEYNK